MYIASSMLETLSRHMSYLMPRTTFQIVHLGLAKHLFLCVILLWGVEILPFTPALALLPCPFLDEYTQVLVYRVVGFAALVNTRILYLSMLTQLFVHLVNAFVKLRSLYHWIVLVCLNNLVFYCFLSHEEFWAASLATCVVLFETYKETEFNEVYQDFVSAEARSEVMLLEIFTIWSVFHAAPLAIKSFKEGNSELYVLGAILGRHWYQKLVSH